MSQYQVDRCICHSRSFEEIRDFARRQRIETLEKLQEAEYCSCGCGLCEPYVKILLETGRTEFEAGEFYRKPSA